MATSPAGQVATATYVPWAEWGAIIALAAAAALAVSAVRLPERRASLVGAAVLAALALVLTFGLV